jgi:hypothetical protein
MFNSRWGFAGQTQLRFPTYETKAPSYREEDSPYSGQIGFIATNQT